MMVLRRHALVRLSQAPGADSEADRERAARWHAAGRPFVVTRRREAIDGVGLGFCTTDPEHPELRPRRVAAHANPALVVDLTLPPALEEIAKNPAASGHVDSFSRLTNAAAAAGIAIRVYGSWMWQALTGERHVHDASDLDVLIDVAGVSAAGRATAFLAEIEPALAFRLDGEISFAGHGEVNWREYRQDRPEVLLKSVEAMHLVPRKDLPA
ncbi:MAG: malonate decarboxylase holo-[acyl-carrier-protein] synthase [Rhodospirillales bacterium]|nr:malonate decarboxylase holo-[acyl-carrier-protein] synthase [Rhodospirillales bacterium]